MMWQPSSALLLAASLLAAIPANADGLYTKKSPVVQVDAKSYDRLIAKSNYTSIVEFYAPWCGHCQNLKPAFEKAAKNLDGLAKVAAVNCDDDANKPLCSQMGVQGFPTLKIMTPSKKSGKPRVEDYQGARSAKAIVDAVVDRIPNHVKKVTDKDVENWLSEDDNSPKAILFTEKGTTSALIRALAIDFLGSIKVGQVRNKETATVERFGVENFPSLVLVPGGGKEHIVYEGELQKKPMIEFLSQVASPNSDPAPAKSNAKSTKSKASSGEDNSKPAESSDPKVVPDDAPEPKAVPVPAPSLDSLSAVEDLASKCLAPKSGTCVLALLPEPVDSDTELPGAVKDALASLSDIAQKHIQRKSKLFPFYSVPATNEGVKALRSGLGLSEDMKTIEIVALNARRGWWRRYESTDGTDFGLAPVEAWIDTIRLGEGTKSKLPDGVVIAEKKDEAETEKETTDHDEL